MTLKFKAFSILLRLAIFTIPLSQQISAVLILITCLFSFLISPIKEIISSFYKSAWDILFYLLVLTVGLFFTTDLTTGYLVIESNLSFLAFPIIFGQLKNFKKEQVNAVFYSFSCGLCLACLICLTNASLTYLNTGEIRSFFFYNLTNVIGFQPTYFAYYLIFVIAYALYHFYYRVVNVNPIIYSVGILFFFLMLILTGGQTAFISLLLVFSFFVLKFITEEKNNTKRIATSLIAFMVACLFLATLIQKAEREWELNDSWDRLVLWESAIDAVPNLIVGVGTGDYKAVLHDYYRAHRMDKFANEYFNSHNQFIQILLANGLLGLLALVLLISRPLYLAIVNQNVLGVLIFFPFLIYGMTEVFFGRYQGIVFFAMIHQFFMMQLQRQKPFSSFNAS